VPSLTFQADCGSIKVAVVLQKKTLNIIFPDAEYDCDIFNHCQCQRESLSHDGGAENAGRENDGREIAGPICRK